MTSTNRKRHYVNNPDFLAAMIEYRKACFEAEDKGEERPVVPNYIGECIFQIATRIATKHNFSGYIFKDDMIMDGVENSLRYILSFNPEKSNNPFAYFSRVVWNSYLHRIAAEKKQLYIRFKASHEALAISETFDGGEDLSVHLNTNVDYINAFVQDYEDKMNAKKAKKADQEE